MKRKVNNNQTDRKIMKPIFKSAIAFAGTVVLAVITQQAFAQSVPSKAATEATKTANAGVLKELPFADKQDFEFAHRGFIARPKSLIIKDSKGNVVWDMDAYNFISENKPAPASVNPSLCA